MKENKNSKINNIKQLVKLETKRKKKRKFKKFFTRIGTNLKKKWLINGGKTILLIVIVIALYIGINIILNNIVLPEIDCTENKIYSLSEETKDKVGNINKEINITLINYGENKSFINFIERYIELNKNIKIEKINDLSSRIDLMTKYSLEPNDSLIIINSESREKNVTESDLVTYDYTTYEPIDKTEEAITNAILDVVTEEKPKIYFMSNHLMYDIQYYSTIMQSIKNEANEIETIDIFSNGKIPEDCDCLILTTLKEDITEKERDNILEYIKNGGKILLMCGPNINNVNLENFQKVLDEYGISLSKGVIFEGDSTNMISGYPDFIIAPIKSTSLTQKLKMSMNVCLIDAGKILFNNEAAEKSNVNYEILAQTTEKSFLRTNVKQNSVSRTSEDDEPESSTIAAIATKTIENGNTSKLVIFSNELFAMDMPVPIGEYTMYTVSLYNNKDMILNSIAYLNEREDIITIRKDSENIKYTVSEKQNIIIMAIIFTLPLIIVIVGIVVWQIRRRK